ncbi:MAG: hypothetical protein FD153_927, partial [Rhodospirillaceae bacterium]
MHRDGAGSDKTAFPGDHFGPGTDDNIDTWLDARIAGLGDPLVIKDQGIRDDGIHRAFLIGDLRLSHDAILD